MLLAEGELFAYNEKGNAEKTVVRRREFMDILKKLTEELGIKLWQTESAVKLIDEGNTIPFISRYRK